MPDDLWTTALAEAYASAPADDYVVSTIELLHPAFVDGDNNADSIRIALDDRDWDLTYESDAPLFAGETKTFQSLAMQVTLPEQTDSSLGTMNLSIDNVPRTVWPMLQAAAKIRASASVIYREWVAVRDLTAGTYSSSGPPDMIINQMTMKVITATLLRLEGTAAFVDILNRNFPRRKFDRDNFPGLFNGSSS